jgi:D-3-phosphoglycerate dehydrogenase / 2-oxoglutarate reductase
MKALVLENIHPTAVDVLRSRGYEVELRPGALREDELIDSLDDVQLLGIRSNTTVTERVLDAAPGL